MKHIWNRIESCLTANRTEILHNLQPGATDEEIEATEKFLGIEFPDDVKLSYRIYNGQFEERPSLIPYWHFLSLGEMIREWKSWKRLLDEGDFKDEDGNDFGCASDGEIGIEFWWNPIHIQVVMSSLFWHKF